MTYEDTPLQGKFFSHTNRYQWEKKKNMLSELQGSSGTGSDSGSSDTVDKSSRVKRYMIGAESFILYSLFFSKNNGRPFIVSHILWDFWNKEDKITLTWEMTKY